MSYYRQYKPTALLTDLIECYWVFRSVDDHSPRHERLIPGGRVEMIFNFADPLQWLISQDVGGGDLVGRAHLMGQRDRIYFARQTGKVDLLGIRFKAGGIAAFTPEPVSGLLNKMTPAEYIFGSVLREWEDVLYEKETDPERIRLLDQVLVRAIRHLPAEWTALSAVIETIRGCSAGASIHDLCHHTGWYYKKLERIFLKNVGYTPKYYYRICRFNKALRQMDTRKTVTLTRICYECGYYDQSHFIKDFQQFAGTNPTHFQSEVHAIADFLIHHQPV